MLHQTENMRALLRNQASRYFVYRWLPYAVVLTINVVVGKMLGAALESFSAGRLGIMQESVGTLSHAAVISIRYAALRKQFGPDRNGPEVPIIEYQLHVSKTYLFFNSDQVTDGKL